MPDEIDRRLGVQEAEMVKIETRPLIYHPTGIGRAGALVTLNRYGALAVYRGYVRPEDEPVEETAVWDGVDPTVAGQRDARDLTDGHANDAHVGTIIMSGGQPVGGDLPEDEDDGALKPLPERLVMELRAHGTLALREALGRSPDGALTLLLLNFVTDTFRTSGASGSCLEAVRLAKGEGPAQLFDYLKKGEMASEAECLLKGSGWLHRADLLTLDARTMQKGRGRKSMPKR